MPFPLKEDKRKREMEEKLSTYLILRMFRIVYSSRIGQGRIIWALIRLQRSRVVYQSTRATFLLLTFFSSFLFHLIVGIALFSSTRLFIGVDNCSLS